MSSFAVRQLMGAGCVALAATTGAVEPTDPPVASETPAAKLSDDGLKLDPVVVNVRRRAESLQDVPAAVTVLTGQTIRDAGITRVEEFTRLVPNVTFESPLNLGQNFLTIRGVTQTVFKPPPAAIVVDGVQIISPLQFNIEQFDLEQIEVLKGPQGAVYGRNAIAGAINITTHKPAKEAAANVLVGLGSGNERKARVAASGPLAGDVLFAGAGLSTTSRGGQLRNITTGQHIDHYDDVTGRVRLLFAPSRAFNADFKYLYSNTKGGDPSYALNPGGNPDDNGAAVRSNFVGSNPRTLHDASAKFDWESSIGTATLILAYVDVGESLSSDYDFSEADIFWVSQRQRERGFSQELRLASSKDSALRWIVGAYHVEKKTRTGQLGYVDPGLLSDPPSPSGVADLRFIDNLDYNRLNNVAVFGQLEYDLAPSLEMALALRHDRDDMHQATRGSVETRNARFERWQPKLTLTKKSNRDFVTYGSYGVGFRSGDFNPTAATIGLPVSRAESGTTYEAGAKTRWFDRRLTLNAAVFLTRMKDYQVQLQDFNTGTNVGINLDKVDIRGAEVEALAYVAPGLSLNAALGLTDAKIKAFALRPDLVGKHPPHLAPYSLNLGVSYERPLGNEKAVFTRADYRRIGSWKWTIENDIARKPVNYLDLHAGVRADGGRWTLAASIRNALDDRSTADYQTAASGGLPSGVDAFSPAVGRSYRLELNYEY